MEGKALCILGMHRSGTSVTASWLERCGLNIGDRLLRADFSNKKGHFEDLDFLELHKAILETHKYPTDGLFPISELNLTIEEIEAMHNLVRRKDSAGIKWGWKEPRTALFLSAYLKKIPELRILYVHRDPSEIISSLLTRDIQRLRIEKYSKNRLVKYARLLSLQIALPRKKKQLFSFYQDVINSYYRHILAAFADVKADQLLFVRLEDIPSRYPQMISFINENWGFNLSSIPFEEVYSGRLLSKKKGGGAGFSVDEECRQLTNLLLKFESKL